jgi:anti-sigma factor RsiW
MRDPSMPDCRSIDPLVTPFVDGELPDADRRAVENHLRLCPPCDARVAAERAIHDLVRARRPGLNASRAPEPLRATCAEMARLNARASMTAGAADAAASSQPAAPSRVPAGSRAPAAASWATRAAPYALAASLVLVVGGAFLYQATEQSARVMAAELAADHVKCFAMNGVLGTHQASAAVESSMMSGFDWRMHLPSDPSRAGLELVGARPCLYGEGKIAHIMYRHQGRPVSLFMLPETARTQELVEVLGHEAAIWCAGNRTFVLVAREPRQDVERLASFVQASLH